MLVWLAIFSYGAKRGHIIVDKHTSVTVSVYVGGWAKNGEGKSKIAIFFSLHINTIPQITALPLDFSGQVIIQIAHCIPRAPIPASILLHMPNKCLIACSVAEHLNNPAILRQT